MAKTAIMSDASWFEKDDNLDDNIDDVIFHFGNIDTVVIQVVIPKIIPQSSGWTHTSVMLASLISSATNQLVLQVMFESVGTKSTNIIVLSTVVIVIKWLLVELDPKLKASFQYLKSCLDQHK